jgi:hypothetical protein
VAVGPLASFPVLFPFPESIPMKTASPLLLSLAL